MGILGVVVFSWMASGCGAGTKLPSLLFLGSQEVGHEDVCLGFTLHLLASRCVASGYLLPFSGKGVVEGVMMCHEKGNRVD
jgi:hypothetical protein